MKTKKIGDNILFFEFKTQKDMALTFFRVQEFYESKNDNLLNKSFSVFDFLEESMTKEGYLDYFYFWSGFNVPGHIVKKWMDNEHGPNYFTYLEFKLIAEVIDNIDRNLCENLQPEMKVRNNFGIVTHDTRDLLKVYPLLKGTIITCFKSTK